VGDAHLVFLGARASGGVGLVMTETIEASARGNGAPVGTPRIGNDEQTVAWRRVVEYVHAESPARIGAQVGALGQDTAAADLAEAAQRAGFAGFDLLVLHLASGQLGAWLAAGDLAALGDAVAAARAAWPADRPLGVRVVDDPPRRDAITAALASLKERGVSVAWIAADADAATAGKTRASVAPLADRVRNELGLATVIEGLPALPADLDALVAAGRCDLCALDRALVVDPGFVHRAADAIGWSA